MKQSSLQGNKKMQTGKEIQKKKRLSNCITWIWLILSHSYSVVFIGCFPVSLTESHISLIPPILIKWSAPTIIIIEIVIEITLLFITPSDKDQLVCCMRNLFYLYNEAYTC